MQRKRHISKYAVPEITNIWALDVLGVTNKDCRHRSVQFSLESEGPVYTPRPLSGSRTKPWWTCRWQNPGKMRRSNF